MAAGNKTGQSTMPAQRRMGQLQGQQQSQTRCQRVRCYLRNNTYIVPLVPMLIILALCFRDPRPSNFFYHAVFLSYPEGPREEGGPMMYGKGLHDITFVAFYTIVMSFSREILMGRYLRPFAVYCGMKGRGKMLRFVEQVYSVIYFSIFGPFGLWVMSRSDLWYFNTTAMFEGFPHRSHTWEFKAYYLLEAAYWAQQGLVLLLQLEKPRKDFKELVMHHIITLSLIALSYRFHFTHMGLAVYITHDISDFFLATSKTFNYLDAPIIGPYFALFACVWVYMRHYLNLKILWAVLTEFRTVGPFELNWETQQYKCWISQYITFGLLASLQSLNMFWFYLIVRIAKNYVFSNVRKDERSSDEESAAEEEEEELEKERAEQRMENERLLDEVQPGVAETTGADNRVPNGNGNGYTNGNGVTKRTVKEE